MTDDYTVNVDKVLIYAGLDKPDLDKLVRRGLFPYPYLIGDDYYWSAHSLKNWKNKNDILAGDLK